MFTMLQSAIVYFLVRWLSQHWGEPLAYWLLGYFTACLVVTGILLLVVWLSGRKPSDSERLSSGNAAKQATAVGAATGG